MKSEGNKSMTLQQVKDWWNYPDRNGSYTEPVASKVTWLINEVEGLRGDVKAAESAFERMLARNTALRNHTAKLFEVLDRWDAWANSTTFDESNSDLQQCIADMQAIGRPE